RDVSLTEAEFRDAAAIVAELGRLSTDTHNEVILMAGSLGVSSLVCLLNNGDQGNTETAQSLLGPFWRLNSPRVENGGSIVRSDTPGAPLFVSARVVDGAGNPIAGAEVDIWHASPVGLYENQDPEQAEMNLRGKFTSDADGRFGFRSVMMIGYPIPTDGVVTGKTSTPEGVPCRFARWDTPAIGKGTVCVFTGRSEFIEKYFETVRNLRQRGFAVAVMDWRGQGHSSRQLPDRRKGHVES